MIANIEAEVSVLGALILNPDAMDVVLAEGLTDQDFASAAHRAIFSAEHWLVTHGGAIDFMLLGEELKSRNALDMVGGLPYLSSLIEAVPAASNAGHYAAIVKERARARQIDMAARTAIDEIARGEKATDVRDRLMGRVEETLIQGMADGGTLGDAIARGAGQGVMAGLSWPWAKLMQATNGIPEGALSIIGAYPGIGKTALTTAALTHLARTGVEVAFFSLEMTENQVVLTLLSREGQINASKLKEHGVDGLDADWKRKAVATRDELAALPFYLDTRPMTADEIAATARVLQRKRGTRVIAIDYLQIIRGSGESRRLVIDEIVLKLKNLAKTTGLAVILLSQMARDKSGQKATAALLKESGGIHEAADLVLLLDRPHFREWATCPTCGGTLEFVKDCRNCWGRGQISMDNEMRVSVEKARLGEAGVDLRLAWYGPHLRVSDWVQL